MASMAKMMLIGNLGRDAEMRYTPQGTAVLEFNLAVNERATQSQPERTLWFRCSLWGKQGESLKTYLTKGKQVFVDGRFTMREYTDREGKARTSLEVRVDNLQLLGGRGEGGGDQRSGGGPPAELDRDDRGGNLGDDDIPF